MFELSFNQVDKHMGTTLILKNINFHIYEGERVGIIGANGCGKSTILRLIAGLEPLNVYAGSWSPGYDFGWIAMPRLASVAYLDQSPIYAEHFKVIDVLNLAFEEVFELEHQMRELEKQMQVTEGDVLDKILMKYSDLSQLYELKGGYNTKEKLGKVCSGLKFDEAYLERPFHLLSGGEQTTVGLGKLLIDSPDILLLDEPTNHLDTDSIEWLEGFLNSYHGIVIVVSHDRYFLDNVVKKIIEIEDLEATTYKGNYSEYVKQKDELMRIQFDNFKEQKKKIEAMEKTIKDLRAWAVKADNKKFFRRAASIQIKLNKMKRIKRPIFERPNMRLDLNSESRSGNETIKATGVNKSYADKTLFKDANLMINYGERVALVGANGSGKTTFLKMLLGDVESDAGELSLGASVKLAYLPQVITFNNEEHTVLECFRDEVVIPEGKGREYLAKYMFYGKTVFTKVKELSGGERIRLKMAKLLFTDVNLLVLDEPTNHLDIESIETIEDALENFNGTIFFISHDRYFINKVGQRIVAIEKNQLKSYDGSYGEYKKIKPEKALALVVSKKIPKVVKPDLTSEKITKKFETTMNELEVKIQTLDAEMASCTDYQMLANMHQDKVALEQSLEEVWYEWDTFQNKSAETI